MKKILYDEQMFTFQRFGGVTRYFADLIYNLPAEEFVADIPMIFCENHYVTETYGNEYKRFSFPANYRLRRRIYSLFNRSASKNAVKHSDYDIFHPTYYNPYFLKSVKERGKQIVLTIHDMTFEQARAYKLPYGLQMPTLEEYFQQAKKYPEIPVILEFKKQSTEERNRTMVQQAVDIARKMKMGKQLEYTTFSETVCRMIREIEPDAKIIYLGAGVHVKDAAYAKEKGYDGISYDLNAWLNHPEIAAQAKQLGIETTLWLSNDYEVIDWVILHEIDYVSTDFPAQAVKYVKAVKEYR